MPLDKITINETIPFQKVVLPTRNKFYEGLELDEEIEVRGMKVQEQKLLLQMNQTNQDDVINKIVYQCIDDRLKNQDLFIIDRDFILQKIREITFGNIVKVEYTCSNCQTENEEEIDITVLPIKYIPDDFKLPIIFQSDYILINNTPQSFEFTIQTTKTLKDISKLQKMMGKEDRATLFLQSIFGNLISINGEPVTLQDKKKLIDMFLNAPQSVLQDLFKQIRTDFGVQTTYSQTCSNCGTKNDVFVLNADFFFHTQ